jgi:hypothetical protein
MNRSSASQEIFHVLWHMEVNDSVYKSLEPSISTNP